MLFYETATPAAACGRGGAHMATAQNYGDQELPGASARRGRSAIRAFFRRHGWSYAFVLPSMLTFTVFVLVPVVWAFIISFQKYSLARGGRWVTPIYDNY